MPWPVIARSFGDEAIQLLAAIVTVALSRFADGNISKVAPIGEGASELKSNRGPGYRLYFGWEGKALVILLGGGTKCRQSDDIAEALAHWRNYKARKARAKRLRGAHGADT